MSNTAKDKPCSYLWVPCLLAIIGIWQIVLPWTFDYGNAAVSPPGRELWLSLDDRILVAKLNDQICGLLLLILSLRIWFYKAYHNLWACCLLGLWQSAAPLIFWAPQPFIYLNDTLLGALIITLSVLIPGLPHLKRFEQAEPKAPTGWSYNPSSWPQRGIIITLAFLAWMVARYLAAYQLGYITTVWEPFFKNGSQQVLNSSISQALPLSDAGLGSLAYSLEFLMGFMGGTCRWRSMPWLVLLLGILIVPVGFISIVLVILQPLIVGAWCSCCLLTALIMLPMIPLASDETYAAVQYLRGRVKTGDSFWHALWHPAQTTAVASTIEAPLGLRKILAESFQGFNTPITLALSLLGGLWLMMGPEFFSISTQSLLSNLSKVLGALIIVFSVISMAEILRSFRYVNVLLGLISACLSLFMSAPLLISNLLAGILVAVLAIPAGIKREKYG